MRNVSVDIDAERSDLTQNRRRTQQGGPQSIQKAAERPHVDGGPGAGSYVLSGVGVQMLAVCDLRGSNISLGKKIRKEGKHRIAAGHYANTAGLANLFKSQARPSLVPR